jgi:hypothetical protein
MADDKRSREKQARDADRRQRERDVAAQLERQDETEPPIDEADLGGVTAALEPLSFPATGATVVETAGERAVDDEHAVADLVPDTDRVEFDSLEAVRARVQRPTVAAAMKRIVEAAGAVRDDLERSQREAYERTLRALEAIDAADDDEGISVVTDWLVERIREDGTLPSSRRVRKRAAEFCRSNGYTVRDDEWLGA